MIGRTKDRESDRMLERKTRYISREGGQRETRIQRERQEYRERIWREYDTGQKQKKGKRTD